MNKLEELLASEAYIVLDGAMGTMLMASGLENGASPEAWNLEHPDRIRAVHRRYIEAGSRVVLTNSFGGSRFRLQLHGLLDRVAEVNEAAARLARAEADAAPHTVVVAGSMGPTGEMIAPLGERTQSEARAAFEEQAAALAAGGADVAWIETMYSEEELAAAIAAVDAVGLPYVATMTFDTNGRTMMGLTPEQAVRNVKRHGSAPLAFGANCGMGPAQLIDSIIGLARGAEEGDVLVAKGNAGLPKMGTDLHLHYDASPAVMADYACLARDVGARIIGGCCGTTAKHLRSMAEALARRPRGPFPDHDTIEARLGPVKVVTEEGPRRRRRR
jgi:methionine synthase I (cobalamin-dependent)